jgi:hypothetical protein
VVSNLACNVSTLDKNKIGIFDILRNSQEAKEVFLDKSWRFRRNFWKLEKYFVHFQIVTEQNIFRASKNFF